MPNIREYNSPVDGLQPSNLGAEAFAQAGRRIGAFFNQEAGLQEQAGAKVGSAIASAGEVGVKYAEHAEISHGAVGAVGLLAGFTDKWNETAKGANDPNDPTVAAKFREEQLEPELAKFRDAFTTEGGQRWAEGQIDSIRKHFYEKTTADMSSLAGDAAVTNTTKSINTLANMLRSDPTAFPMAQKMLTDAVDGITSSTNLLPSEAARVKGQLMQHGNEQLSRAAIQSAIERNPDEGMKLAGDPRFAPYVTASDAQAFYQQTVQVRKTDALLAKQQQEQQIRQSSEQIRSQVLRQLYDPDPAKPMPTAKDIVDLPPDKLSGDMKVHLISMLKDKANGVEIPEAAAKWNAVNMVVGVREGKVTSPDEVTKAMNEHKIDYAGAQIIERELEARKTPEGQAIQASKKDLMDRYRDILNPVIPMGIGGHMPEGGARLYEAEQEIQRRIDAAKSGGKDWHSLFDDRSPDFIGKYLQSKAPTPAYMMIKAKALLQQQAELSGKSSSELEKLAETQVPGTPPSSPPPADARYYKGKYYTKGPNGEAVEWHP